ncbi:MAG: YveK family protein [Planctomycetaceae bacterium]
MKRYGSIVRRRWYRIVVGIVITAGLTYLLQSSKTPTYTSTGSLQVVCTSTDPGDRNSCNAVLTNNPQIIGNYSTLVQSDRILAPLEGVLQGAKPDRYVVSSSVETDTTIVQISVTGPDAQIVYAYTNAIMQKLIAYADNNDVTYGLTVVDQPEVAAEPNGSNKKLTLAIAVFLGFFVGLALALFMEYLGQSDEREQARDIIDEATGVHNERYLRRRLLEETSRARRSGHGFTFAVLTVALPGGEDGETAHVPPARALRSLARGLDATVPEEGVLGYLGAGTFAALLPEVPVTEASSMLVGWDVAATSLLTSEVADATQGPRVSTALCEYRDGVFVGDREAKRPAHWLTSVRMQVPETPASDAAEPVVIVDTEDLQDAAGPSVPAASNDRKAPARVGGAKRSGGRKSTARAKGGANGATAVTEPAAVTTGDPAAALAGDQRRGESGGQTDGQGDGKAGRTEVPSGIVVPHGSSSVAVALQEAARRKEGSHPTDGPEVGAGPAGEGTTSAGQRG